MKMKQPNALPSADPLEESASACTAGPTIPSFDPHRVLRYNGTGWDGVRATIVHDGQGHPTGTTHRILTTQPHTPFEVRYIEVEPGSVIDLGVRTHAWIVMGQRGHGQIQINGDSTVLGYGDVAYIGRDEPCRLSNPGAEPFGLLCVVDAEAERDSALEVSRADA